MLGGEAAAVEREAQGVCFIRAVFEAEQAAMHTIEQMQLVFGAGVCVVSDVVGGTGEAVERHDHGAMTRVDEHRGDGEILVGMGFAGGKVWCFGHVRMACALPFHIPPLPRQNWSAESMVKAV